MFRSSLRISPRRAGESDTSIMVLVGMVLVLLLIVAALSGLGLWQWRQAEIARRMAEEQRMVALEAEQQARMQLEEARFQNAQDARGKAVMISGYSRAGGLVTAPAAGPMNVLPLLSPLPRDQ